MSSDEHPNSGPVEEQFVSLDQYLQFENNSPGRHEYVDGRIFTMTGGTQRHSTISQNLYAILREQLKGGRCRAYIHEMKVHVEASNSIYYPDVVVTCEKRDDNSLFAARPGLIVEVSSPSTALVDRREKAMSYKLIPSLAIYMVVDYKRKRVELHQRLPGTSDSQSEPWTITHFNGSDELDLSAAVGNSLKLRVSQLYLDTDLEHTADLEVREGTRDYGPDFEAIPVILHHR